MKAGFLQFAPCLMDQNKTISNLETLFSQDFEADLLVLPELCNSGYNFPNREEAFACAETSDKSEFIDFLVSVAQKKNCFISSGFHEKDGDKLFNSSVLVGPKGLVGKYRKLHLFLNEKDIFEPGDLGLPVFETEIGKIGMLVCFDWIFPETWRILALKGAEIICHTSNLVLPGFAQKAVPVQALMNRVFAITANRIGTEGNLTFTGMSTIASPKGDVIYQAKPDQNELKVVEIDLAESHNKFMTPRNNVFEDRRVEFFDEILKK